MNEEVYYDDVMMHNLDALKLPDESSPNSDPKAYESAQNIQEASKNSFSMGRLTAGLEVFRNDFKKP